MKKNDPNKKMNIEENLEAVNGGIGGIYPDDYDIRYNDDGEDRPSGSPVDAGSYKVCLTIKDT